MSKSLSTMVTPLQSDMAGDATPVEEGVLVSELNAYMFADI
jgi:hypothetical protein